MRASFVTLEVFDFAKALRGFLARLVGTSQILPGMPLANTA
jgi:hypothetical protein